jgi:thiamine biosynthesis lipoprotein
MAQTDNSVQKFLALGTVNSIQVFGHNAAYAARAAMQRVLDIHRRMSVFSEGSDIFRLNASAGCAAVHVHPDTFSLLLLAKEYTRKTKGAFDITLRPLSALWDVSKRGDFIPPDAQIKKTLACTGPGRLELFPNTMSARLARPGMSVDLGGIAKGYAGDEVKRILAEHGCENARINLGGNIVALGRNPQGEPWRIGVQNPLRPRGKTLLSLDIQNASVVTSGTGERFFMKDGKRYHHILDPKTGKPAQKGLLSVTVVSLSGTAADALATALFVLGAKKGLSLLRRDPGNFFKETKTQVLFVSEELNMSATPAFKASSRSLVEVQ